MSANTALEEKALAALDYPDVYVMRTDVDCGPKLLRVGSLASLKHWMVVFSFPSGDVLQCEAFEHYTGKIRGSITDLKFLDIKYFLGKMEHLGKAPTTKEEIRSVVAKMNEGDDDYRLVANNCQHWVKLLLAKFGITLTDMDAQDSYQLGKFSVIGLGALLLSWYFGRRSGI